MRHLEQRVIAADGRIEGLAAPVGKNAVGGCPPGGLVGAKAGASPRSGRTVTVNIAESPLGWLASRRLIDARQLEAGERLRFDYERAAIAPSVTMAWSPRVDGGGGDTLDFGAAQIAARRRFDAAVAAVGPGLGDVLWRVVCGNEGLPVAERALGWPARAGRVVLTLALDRLATHYGLRATPRDRADE